MREDTRSVRDLSVSTGDGLIQRKHWGFLVFRVRVGSRDGSSALVCLVNVEQTVQFPPWTPANSRVRPGPGFLAARSSWHDGLRQSREVNCVGRFAPTPVLPACIRDFGCPLP